MVVAHDPGPAVAALLLDAPRIRHRIQFARVLEQLLGAQIRARLIKERVVLALRGPQFGHWRLAFERRGVDRQIDLVALEPHVVAGAGKVFAQCCDCLARTDDLHAVGAGLRGAEQSMAQ